MMPTKNLSRIALCLILFFTAFTITLTNATTENNYNTDNNFLTNISESTHTENGYKTNIIINPNIAGIYANENGYKLDLSINTQGIGRSLKENNYKLNLIPEKTFPDIPDIAITKIVTSKTVVGQGYSIIINVTVANQALNYETFYITINANTTLKEQKITLTSMKSTTITFTWNTTGFAKGNYTISAYATPVLGETHTADNTLVYGTVIVTIPGDVVAPYFEVDIYDVTAICICYDSKIGPPRDPLYYPNCDLDGNGIIDIYDVTAACITYGQKYP
jgi:hypothetical protein